MDLWTFNKVAAAVLLTLLVLIGADTAISILYPEGGPGEYKVVQVEEETETAEAEQQEAEEQEPQVQTLPVRLASAEPSAGETLFRQCSACHSANEGGRNMVGPNLWSVVGREVAAAEGFSYSNALQEYGGEWAYERLDCFLENPSDCVPGTNMGYAGIKDPEKRADMIAYLASLGEAPPFPEVEEEAAETAEAAPDDEAAPSDEQADTSEMAAADATAGAEQADKEAAQGAEQAAGEDAAEAAGDADKTKLAALFADADAAAGENSVQTCVACHSFNEGGPTKVGPNLYGIVGDKVAAADGYSYSNALKDLGGEWTYERMNAWLKAPMEYAPGTTMAYPGVKDDAKRADIIAYLASLGDAPPLPGSEQDANDGDSADAGARGSDETRAARLGREGSVE